MEKIKKWQEIEILYITKKLYHNHLTPEVATNLLLDIFADTQHSFQETTTNNIRDLIPSDDRIVAEAIHTARKVDTEVGLLPSNNDIKMFCLGAKWMRDLVQNNTLSK